MTVRWYARQQNWPLERVEVSLTHGKGGVDGKSAKADHFAKTIRISGIELTEALLVNPHSKDEISDERKRRWEALIEGIRRDDVHHWRRAFLAALASAPCKGDTPVIVNASADAADEPSPAAIATSP